VCFDAAFKLVLKYQLKRERERERERERKKGKRETLYIMWGERDRGLRHRKVTR
jgi:hypothetical protein